MRLYAQNYGKHLTASVFFIFFPPKPSTAPGHQLQHNSATTPQYSSWRLSAVQSLGWGKIMYILQTIRIHSCWVITKAARGYVIEKIQY